MASDTSPKYKLKWEQYIPWYITIASTITLFVVGYFLIVNIEWFKNSIFSVKEYDQPAYRIYAYHLHLSMIKRSVGLFSGFAVMFLGIAVFFYSLKDKTTGELRNVSFTAALSTSSPGIIALMVGGYLIVATIQSKDSFPDYNSSGQQIEPYIPPVPK